MLEKPANFDYLKMKSLILVLFLFYLLSSCSNPNDNRIIKNSDLIGKWKTERITMRCFRGLFQEPLRDSLKLPAEYLGEEFYLKFLNDTVYNYENKFGKVIMGKYERNNDSLKLGHGIEQYDWIRFRIDSLSFDRLYLSNDGPEYMFYLNNDAITIRTGEGIKVILHKENIH
jgi:hypothetical protein